MALRLALRTTHRLAATAAAAQQRAVAPAAATMASRRFSERGIFDDQEEAREVQYIRKKDQEHLKDMLIRMQTAQLNQTEAKDALSQILGPNIPEEVVQQLFAWKDKYARTRLGVTGLER